MQELHTPANAAAWLHQHVRGTLQTDSRKLKPGDGFIAWPGAAHDARVHVPAAQAQGASACLVEREGIEAHALPEHGVASYRGLKAASALIASTYYDTPSHALQVLAVTGTNGKTSTAWWLAQALSSPLLTPAWPCAVVGTLGVGRPPAADASDDELQAGIIATGLTTPDPVLLQASLRRFVDGGLRACALEASSIGIDEHRLDGTELHTAIFTNFTQDHLDYHGSMDAYWRAKARLFNWPGLKAAVVNIDDAKGPELLQQLDGRELDVWSVSCTAPARLQARNIRIAGDGLVFDVVEGAQSHTLATTLIGQYNVANLLGVIAAMRTLGIDLAQAVAACTNLSAVPGRMQRVRMPDMPLVAIDYAHTPDALDKALQALRPLAQQRSGQLWCVFGCGGNRDPGKRPQMGVAARAADQIIVTSDNPRNENPQAIIDQVMPALNGHGGVSAQLDRARAIAMAVGQASAADVVLVAGKGHEDYQELAGERRPFSDLTQVRSALAQRAAGVTP
jgi:UDP-N-acetylmuramoyl-L-alanyl-D-glutamate--2,6-diaminopimelate ligase